jgi:adenine-specific DNA-methyltransferase
MIKYIGSKRRLVPALTALAAGAGAHTALDLFTGTTRVAQAFKRQGMSVTAVDTATYAEVLAQAYIVTDGAAVDLPALSSVLGRLSALPGRRGYVTKVFCERARYFHPENGARIDAIRDEIEAAYSGTALFPLLLTSLLQAADRVDSTTGLQMAYLKTWAPRALRPLELRLPELIPGAGVAIRGDALAVAPSLSHVDLAYVDPPYNQHRYFSNYHVWETLVRWDAPEFYGVACKRVDCTDDSSMSPFNRRGQMGEALAQVIEDVDAEVMVVSYNDEAWLSLDELVAMCSRRRASGRTQTMHVQVLVADSKRYVGAQIGIHNPAGAKVGEVSHLRNKELLVISGPRDVVDGAADAAARVLGPDGGRPGGGSRAATAATATTTTTTTASSEV